MKIVFLYEDFCYWDISRLLCNRHFFLSHGKPSKLSLCIKRTLLSSCFFYILVWTWFFDHYESGPQLVAWVGTNISFRWSAGKLTIITANLCSKTWSPFCHSKINMDFYFIDFILFFHLNQFFIAFFSIGMGAVPWLIMSEVTSTFSKWICMLV